MAARERAELEDLYRRVKAAYEGSPYAEEHAAIDFSIELVAEASRRAGIRLPREFDTGVAECVYTLTREDPVMFWMPEFPDILTIEATASLRAILSAKERFLSDPPRYEDIWREKVLRILEGFFGYLPPLALEGQFSVPVVDVCNVPEIVERLMFTLYDDDVVSTDLFVGIREQFERNLVSASGLTFEEARRRPNAITKPKASKLPAAEVAATYLYGTAFDRLFDLTIPFSIPEHARFEHTHIVAGSGHGKTQTLQHLILADLQRPHPPGLVIIDSQGDMIRKVSKLALFDGPLKDKLIIIDPRDVDHPPALNMFDVNLERISGYGAADREQILNGVIELYEYFFGSLLGAELTQKQTLIFRYLARLMIHIPAATIRTLIELMDSTKPYQHVIDAMPESTRMPWRSSNLQMIWAPLNFMVFLLW